MEQILKVPEFKTEGDEARWWAENPDRLAQLFARAAAEGKLGRGTVARRGNTPTTTIRLDPGDIAKARLHAERKGLKYQTYLKMLIHQALQQEDRQAGPVTQRGVKSMPKAPKTLGLDAPSRKKSPVRRKAAVGE